MGAQGPYQAAFCQLQAGKALSRCSWVKDLIEGAAKGMTDYALRLQDYISMSLTLSLHGITPVVPLLPVPAAYHGMTWVASFDAARLLRQFWMVYKEQPEAAFTEDGYSGQALAYAEAVLQAEALAHAQVQAYAQAQAFAEVQAQLHVHEPAAFVEVNDDDLADLGMDFTFVN